MPTRETLTENTILFTREIFFCKFAVTLTIGRRPGTVLWKKSEERRRCGCWTEPGERFWAATRMSFTAVIRGWMKNIRSWWRYHLTTEGERPWRMYREMTGRYRLLQRTEDILKMPWILWSRSMEQIIFTRELNFFGPQSRTYEFLVDKEMVLGPETVGTEELDYYSFVNSGTFMVVWTALAIFLGLCALIVPALPVVSLGTGRISRIPLGIILAVLFCDACMVLGGASLLELTFSGEFAGGLATGLGFGNWNDAVLIANGVYWGITFAVVFWAALCMRAVFTIGPWRYFKERTLIGLCLRLIKRAGKAAGRWWDRFMASLGQLDWSEKSNKVILRIVLVNFLVLVLICCFWFFGIFALIVYSVVLFVVLRRYWEKARQKYQILLLAINEMADGNLDVEIQEDLWIFTPFYQQLTRIQKGFKKAVQEEVKSQRMKTELVTNVSHDLKTPLTAIITYVNLLKKENATEEEKKELY